MHFFCTERLAVDRAARLIHPLLTPLDEQHNVHKQRQLAELAEINGTLLNFSSRAAQERLREEEEEKNAYALTGDVKRRVDAMYEKDVAEKLRRENGGGGTAGGGAGMDDEYESFLSELTDNLGKGAGVPGRDGSGGGGGGSGVAASARPHHSPGVPPPVAPIAPVGPGWAPGSMPEHLRPVAPAFPAAAPTASPAAPASIPPEDVLIPSTAAIDAGLALSGVYGAGIAAAASVANGVALMRRTLTRERESKAARKKAGTTQLARGGGGGGDAGTSDAPPPRASDEPEIAEEVVDDEYARMMAELED